MLGASTPQGPKASWPKLLRAEERVRNDQANLAPLLEMRQGQPPDSKPVSHEARRTVGQLMLGSDCWRGGRSCPGSGGSRRGTLRLPRALDEPARAEREGGQDRVEVLLLEHEQLGPRGHPVPDSPELCVYPSAWSAGGTSAECRAMFPAENPKPQSAARKTAGHRRAQPSGRNAANSNPHRRTDQIAVQRCSL